MYYLRIYSSEKDGSIMLPFNNDLESLITYVVDQHERIIRYLESNNKKYEKSHLFGIRIDTMKH